MIPPEAIFMFGVSTGILVSAVIGWIARYGQDAR